MLPLRHPYYTLSQQWPSQPRISLYLHDCKGLTNTEQLNSLLTKTKKGIDESFFKAKPLWCHSFKVPTWPPPLCGPGFSYRYSMTPLHQHFLQLHCILQLKSQSLHQINLNHHLHHHLLLSRQCQSKLHLHQSKVQLKLPHKSLLSPVIAEHDATAEENVPVNHQD